MTTTHKPLSLKWLFLGFSGRITRQSYALSVLFQLTMLTLLIYQAVQAGEDEAKLVTVGFLLMALGVFLIWSILALSIKRMHDLNHHPALIILLFVPMVNWPVFLYLMLKPSHPETNEHGPPPFGKG